MNKTKIEWTDYTWNPITGCRNNCWYCYAKKLSVRFHGNFIPTFHKDRLDDFSPYMKIKKFSKIFEGITRVIDIMTSSVNWKTCPTCNGSGTKEESPCNLDQKCQQCFWNGTKEQKNIGICLNCDSRVEYGNFKPKSQEPTDVEALRRIILDSVWNISLEQRQVSCVDAFEWMEKVAPIIAEALSQLIKPIKVPSVEDLDKFLLRWGLCNGAFQKNAGFRRKLAQACIDELYKINPYMRTGK